MCPLGELVKIRIGNKDVTPDTADMNITEINLIYECFIIIMWIISCASG